MNYRHLNNVDVSLRIEYNVVQLQHGFIDILSHISARKNKSHFPSDAYMCWYFHA